jgi:outer membrane biosynthesis protein TonB
MALIIGTVITGCGDSTVATCPYIYNPYDVRQQIRVVPNPTDNSYAIVLYCTATGNLVGKFNRCLSESTDSAYITALFRTCSGASNSSDKDNSSDLKGRSDYPNIRTYPPIPNAHIKPKGEVTSDAAPKPKAEEKKKGEQAVKPVEVEEPPKPVKPIEEEHASDPVKSPNQVTDKLVSTSAALPPTEENLEPVQESSQSNQVPSAKVNPVEESKPASNSNERPLQDRVLDRLLDPIMGDKENETM